MDRRIAQRIHEALAQHIVSLTPLSGGCVADVRLARLASGERVVLKIGTPSSRLDIEGAMLRDLAATPCPVPRVIACEPDLLIMAYVEHDGRLGAPGQRHAAEILAALHATTNETFGYPYDTLIASLPQPNTPSDDWVRFFADHRLRFMADLAHQAGHLSTRTRDRIERLADGPLRELIGTHAPPGLIHGDIWSGNVLAHAGSIAAFIDPAVSFADPEVELAFIRLFGTFDDVFFDRYDELRPIREGFFEVRADLYNLYPLLVHTRLFASGYARSVERILDRLGV